MNDENLPPHINHKQQHSTSKTFIYDDRAGSASQPRWIFFHVYLSFLETGVICYRNFAGKTPMNEWMNREKKILNDNNSDHFVCSGVPFGIIFLC